MILHTQLLTISLQEVLNCIVNLSRETRDYNNPLKAMVQDCPIECNSDENKFDHFFEKECSFSEPKRSSISKGTYNDGSLEKFISRIRSKLNDARLSFLLGERAEKLTFEETIREILGYRKGNEANVTVIDLSGIPFEVLSITVSLMSRILFDYGYYYKRLAKDNDPKTPLLLVYEEAHRYVPKLKGARYSASRHAIERIVVSLI